MENQKSNRSYKDGVFIRLFSEKEKLVELYNAIEGTHYAPDTPLTIETLQDTLYGIQKNDIAFTMDDKFIILLEHQSTINKNMPVRMLLYISRIYEKLIKEEDIYRSKVVPIPYPELYVLYNGAADYPEKSILRLSDAYKVRDKELQLELIVKVININYGKNETLLNTSETLYQYSLFIHMVRDYEMQGNPRDAAIERAIKDCIKKDILKEFLEKNGSEVHNMLFTEWNLEDAIRIASQEAAEDAAKKALQEGLNQGLSKGLSQGLSQGLNQGALKAETDLLRALYFDGIVPMKQLRNYAKTMSLQEFEDFCKALAEEQQGISPVLHEDITPYSPSK